MRVPHVHRRCTTCRMLASSDPGGAAEATAVGSFAGGQWVGATRNRWPGDVNTELTTGYVSPGFFRVLAAVGSFGNIVFLATCSCRLVDHRRAHNCRRTAPPSRTERPPIYITPGAHATQPMEDRAPPIRAATARARLTGRSIRNPQSEIRNGVVPPSLRALIHANLQSSIANPQSTGLPDHRVPHVAKEVRRPLRRVNGGCWKGGPRTYPRAQGKGDDQAAL